MPRYAFKPDASFFEKIAIGAVGARAVVSDLHQHGHDMVELENGSTATKMWKDVKRKRVRIPDLVCTRCGLRVESRAKSNKPELSVSHSASDAERAWDFGLVAGDLIAFPVCSKAAEAIWSAGRLQQDASYWHSRDRIRWTASRLINYFRVGDLRSVSHSGSTTKGVTEGSETSISWDAVFASQSGVVESVAGEKIRVRFAEGGSYTWQNAKKLAPRVKEGEAIAEHQVLAAPLPAAAPQQLTCPGHLPPDHIFHLLASPERTQRFTGIKLARLRNEKELQSAIREIGGHSDEDIYVRLEAAAYLVAVCGDSAKSLFLPPLNSTDDQIRLETVVALAAAATPDAVGILSAILGKSDAPYFLRSAAAWALGQIGTEEASAKLIETFADGEWTIREEALDAVGNLTTQPYKQLTTALLGLDKEKAAGAAEALRRYAISPIKKVLPKEALVELTAELKRDTDRVWIVWLLAALPRGIDYVDAAVAEVQEQNPRAHFAMSVLWSFLRSWIAPSWELYPYPEPLRPSDA